jgi:phenylacetic acid degradation operon negative regulatory protein
MSILATVVNNPNVKRVHHPVTDGDLASPPEGVAPLRPRWVLFTLVGQALMVAGQSLPARPLRELMAVAGLTDGASRSALNRMVASGWLAVDGTGSDRRYQVTRHMADVIYTGETRLMTGREPGEEPLLPEGEWCLAIYEVPETQRAARDRLRRELGLLGFGCLAAAVWACARDRGVRARSLAAGLGLTDRLWTLRAHLEFDDERALVRRCWDLDEVQHHYAAFLERWEARRRTLERGQVTDAVCFREDLFLLSDYRWFLRADPGLRPSLLPDGWLGPAAHAFYREYHGVLAPRAGAFLAAAFRRAGPVEPGIRSGEVHRGHGR